MVMSEVPNSNIKINSRRGYFYNINICAKPIKVTLTVMV